MKQCKNCREVKPLSEFHPSPKNRGGVKPQCKVCYRKKQIEYRFKLTGEAHGKLLDKQDGRCAICGRSNRKLHVDHDHDTGAVRGLLCGPCNRSIGVLGDTAEKLMRAVRYLQGGDDGWQTTRA